MKKYIYKELKFVIGEQYESYEFDLEDVDLGKFVNLKYDSYRYIKGDIKTLFDLEITKEIYLLFNADILSAVCYRFKGSQYEYLRDKINSYLEEPMIESKCKTYRRAETFIEELSDVLELRQYYDNGDTGLCFQNTGFHMFYEDPKFPTKLVYPF